LALMCHELVSTKNKKVERYIREFPERIKGYITPSKPITLHDAINMARELVEQAVQGRTARIEIHHGGVFTNAPNRVYNGGKVNWFDQIDSNGFSVVEVTSMLAGLGYVNLIMQYWYKIPNRNLDNGLLPLTSDNDVLKFIKYTDRFKLMHLYVMHPVDKPKEIRPNENLVSKDDFDPFFCDIDPDPIEQNAS
ncbi:hypothetical protein Tco_0294967, partial [Tanacetum coccineum]